MSSEINFLFKDETEDGPKSPLLDYYRKGLETVKKVAGSKTRLLHHRGYRETNGRVDNIHTNQTLYILMERFCPLTLENVMTFSTARKWLG